MAESAGVHFDAGHFAGGMTDKRGSIAAKSLQLRVREKAAVGQHHVKGLDRVAFALDVTVARWVLESLGGDAEDAVVEDVQNIETRQAAAGVARASVEDRLQQTPAEAEGFEGEISVRQTWPRNHNRNRSSD